MIARLKNVAVQQQLQNQQQSTSPRDGICAIANCGRPEESRGLCGSCYGYARKLVKSNVTSWQQLEEPGLARAPHQEPRSPFRIAFDAAMAAQRASGLALSHRSAQKIANAHTAKARR